MLSGPGRPIDAQVGQNGTFYPGRSLIQAAPLFERLACQERSSHVNTLPNTP
jgi:hypothetical protein